MNREVGFELAVGFQITSFVRCVSVDYVGYVVLEFTEGEENDIALDDPNLVDMGQQVLLV
jgi:hypothetical protein